MSLVRLPASFSKDTKAALYNLVVVLTYLRNVLSSNSKMSNRALMLLKMFSAFPLRGAFTTFRRAAGLRGKCNCCKCGLVVVGGGGGLVAAVVVAVVGDGMVATAVALAESVAVALVAAIVPAAGGTVVLAATPTPPAAVDPDVVPGVLPGVLPDAILGAVPGGVPSGVANRGVVVSAGVAAEDTSSGAVRCGVVVSKVALLARAVSATTVRSWLFFSIEPGPAAATTEAAGSMDDALWGAVSDKAVPSSLPSLSLFCSTCDACAACVAFWGTSISDAGVSNLDSICLATPSGVFALAVVGGATVVAVVVVVVEGVVVISCCNFWGYTTHGISRHMCRHVWYTT
jgi:hypothetical protein